MCKLQHITLNYKSKVSILAPHILPRERKFEKYVFYPFILRQLNLKMKGEKKTLLLSFLIVFEKRWEGGGLEVKFFQICCSLLSI